MGITRLLPRHLGRRIGGMATGALALAFLGGGTATAAVPIGRPMSGEMTYYDDVGYGACGTPIDASSQYLVAVSYQWWTAANPNSDPLCSGISVQVTYDGHTLTVPVADKCPTCDAGHIDLSQPAFAQFAPLGTGVVTGITWQFVSSGGSTPPPVGAPAGLHVTAATSTSVSLSWSQVTGAASYRVYRDGSAAGTTAATSFTDSGVQPGTSYSYTVAAVGSDGTPGAPSAGYTATYYSTGAVPDSPSSWAVWSDKGTC